MGQFLISVNWEGGQSCESEGELMSLSDDSEHQSYNCLKYLTNRKQEVKAAKIVPFVWRTPQCSSACFQLKYVIYSHGHFMPMIKSRKRAINQTYPIIVSDNLIHFWHLYPDVKIEILNTEYWILLKSVAYRTATKRWGHIGDALGMH